MVCNLNLKYYVYFSYVIGLNIRFQAEGVFILFSRKMALPFSSIGIMEAFGFVTLSHSHFLLNIWYIRHGPTP